MTTTTEKLLAQFERAVARKAVLFNDYMGKAMPDAVYQEFAILRDDTVPELRDALGKALAAHEAAQAQAVEDERGAFEAACLAAYPETFDSYPNKFRRSTSSEEYEDVAVMVGWRMWQARAGRASAQAVPAGFVLVPVEPTETMTRAAESVEDLYKRGTPNTWAAVYHAMLAAAPKGD